MAEFIEIEEKFFNLLQLAVGNTNGSNLKISDDEWRLLYQEASKQSLLGVALCAADKLSEVGQKPPMDLLLQWIGEGESIRNRSRIVDEHCKQLTGWFEKRGCKSCVLKGQGVARLYPQPEYRQAGDIDIWVDAERDEIVKWMRSDFMNVTYVDYVNCHAAFFTDTEVEVHFRPTWMFNPFTNIKVQKWIRENKDAQMDNYDEKVGFSYPTIGFNLVFSLIHIYRHVFFEGIGLRHLMDYYWILSHSTDEERTEAFESLKSFGVGKFAASIMYIMRRVFDIDESLLLCKPNEEDGQFLLGEIMRGGNFGHFDDRNTYVPEDKKIKRGLNNSKRNLRFLKRYPSEVMWMPVWKTWHWCWRKYKGYL